MEINSEEIKNATQKLSAIFKTISSEIQKSLDAFKEIKFEPPGMKIDPTENLIEAGKRVKELLDNLPSSLKILSNMGWYLNFMDMTPKELYDLEQVFKSGDTEQINNCLMDIVEEKLPSIQKRIIDKFPNRKEPLQAAFKAHIEKEFYLSIPVFLAQADGICKEKYGKKFYSTNNKKPKISSVIKDKIKSDIMKTYIDPLLYLGAVNSPEGDRPNFIGTLNRHEVLHGISNDYGTKLNSLQAISLLDYIYGLLE